MRTGSWRALAGHGLGEAFQPHQGGTSVAFCGILGGLGAWSLFEREPELRAWRGRATLAIPPSILDTALGDIHGVAYLAGLLSGTAWALRGSPHAPADPRWQRHRVARSGRGPAFANGRAGAGLTLVAA